MKTICVPESTSGKQRLVFLFRKEVVFELRNFANVCVHAVRDYGQTPHRSVTAGAFPPCWSAKLQLLIGSGVAAQQRLSFRWHRQSSACKFVSDGLQSLANMLKIAQTLGNIRCCKYSDVSVAVFCNHAINWSI